MDYFQLRELYHHGIKDQKWGVRRYQNYDGTLTAEGRERYNKGSKENAKEGTKATLGADGNFYYTDKTGKKVLFKTRVDQLSDTELQDLNRRIKQEKELHREASEAYEYKGPKEDQALRDASRLAKDLAAAIPAGTGKTVKKDYSELSDQELRNRINRLQLEDSYGKLSGDTVYVKSGQDKLREFLQTAGAALAVAGSAATLALTIREIKKGQARQSDISYEDINSLEHHGIKGQKWGVRNYQNPDGTLTAEGRARYNGKSHVSELDDRELADLEAQERAESKRKLKIGIAIAATAATAIIGAAWYAKHKQEMQATTVNQVTTSQNVKELPLSKKVYNKPSIIDKKSYIKPTIFDKKVEHPNVPDWLTKSNNGSKPASSLLTKSIKQTPKYHPRDITDTYHKTANRYYRLEKDIHGNPFKISKADWAKAPKIHINHFDSSDYLVFRAIYLGGLDILCHHGIKGQKWGVRRYQEEDGSLTPEGKRRYRTDAGTKEMLDASSRFDKLTKEQQKEYAKYGRISGAKRGFLAGLAGGALIGVGKTALNYAFAKTKTKTLGDGSTSIISPSGRSIANSFTRNAMLGALGGSVVGTLIGSVAGKKSAQAQLADKGRVYVDQLLNTPINRVRRDAYHTDILDEDENSLAHYGVKGQKWGVRNYQNPDGSLTEAGQERYSGKTHINQLTDEETADLYQDIANSFNKRTIKRHAIAGSSLALGAAVSIGAAYLTPSILAITIPVALGSIAVSAAEAANMTDLVRTQKALHKISESRVAEIPNAKEDKH